ncbi:putative bifunctional diguanylate cyclase/phosphodiesterase, partial [Trichothermofontia sp.]
LGVGTIGGIGAVLFNHLIWIPITGPILGFLGTMGVVMAQRLRYTTTHDRATGLLNADAFIHRLGRSLARPSHQPESLPWGVLVLTIARFERLQASLEGDGGDRLCRQFVNRLRTVLPRASVIARLGAAEFAVYLPGTQANLTALAERLQASLTEPLVLPQKSVILTTPIGIALSQADYQYTPENLLRDARTAMYRAQSLGKTCYEVFATGMQQAVVEQLTLESELRQGIAAQEFVLYYQPMIALSTGTIVGFEALIRWQHPRRGVVPPLAFIPLAEETGLIIPLGAWICQAACQQAHQWQTLFPDRPLVLSINLSSRQFEQPDLTEQLAVIIHETGVAGFPLKFEITESMVMGDIETAIDRMLRLKALGCQLGLDDFGTGYSSLSYLRRFPVDTLKIDKSFVQKMGQSPEDAAIVRMIIDLGHTLGMDVVAEGVETQVDADHLRSLGCDFGQGYFWAKPLPAAQATDLLQEQFKD